MADGPPTLVKREVKLPDGRRLIFYDFPEAGEPLDGEPRGGGPDPAAPPPRRPEP